MYQKRFLGQIYWKIGKDFIEEGEKGNEILSTDSENVQIIKINNNQLTKKIVEDIYGLLMLLGIAITVIVGAILGIKFVISSAEDKAKIKEYMVPYVVGCLVIYGAFAIWKLCVSVISNNIGI